MLLQGRRFDRSGWTQLTERQSELVLAKLTDKEKRDLSNRGQVSVSIWEDNKWLNMWVEATRSPAG